MRGGLLGWSIKTTACTHRDDQRQGCEDILRGWILRGWILRVVFLTVHLTLLLTVEQTEHDLLPILGLGSALDDPAHAWA